MPPPPQRRHAEAHAHLRGMCMTRRWQPPEPALHPRRCRPKQRRAPDHCTSPPSQPSLQGSSPAVAASFEIWWDMLCSQIEHQTRRGSEMAPGARANCASEPEFSSLLSARELGAAAIPDDSLGLLGRGGNSRRLAGGAGATLRGVAVYQGAASLNDSCEVSVLFEPAPLSRVRYPREGTFRLGALSPSCHTRSLGALRKQHEPQIHMSRRWLPFAFAQEFGASTQWQKVTTNPPKCLQ